MVAKPNVLPKIAETEAPEIGWPVEISVILPAITPEGLSAMFWVVVCPVVTDTPEILLVR